MRPRAALSLATLAALAPGATAPAAPYKATPGPFQETARFDVSYEGSGTYRTRFHGTPPNPKKRNDRNDARDASAQSWSLRFPPGVTIPTCSPQAETDPCPGVHGVTGARGTTLATARIDHTHVDGIYPELDRRIRCRLRERRTAGARPLAASVTVRHDPAAGTFAVGASNPVSTVLEELPAACPRQGDSIDRILDNYAIPGFSFADSYGPDRWFASRAIAIPEAVFHGSTTITIRLADTARGTPPRGCAVPHPSYERCRTGGSWSGVLVFRRR
jgi:hypothetical protein